MLHKLLFEGRININRRAYAWNLVSSITFSIQSALFLLIITRLGGEKEAGSFIILFTVAQTLNAVGNYNIRDFQVSDIHEEYRFSSYYTTRIITCVLMALLALAYCAWKGLSAARTATLMALVGYRFIECVEDVYHGDVHRAGRFDVTSICMSMRIIVSSLAFCCAYALSGSQVTAALTMVAVSALIFLFTSSVIKREYKKLKPSCDFGQVKNLLVFCFPLFVGTFLYSYLINAPKYAIDDLLSADVQTIYNILFMPVFVVNILSTFIYKPVIVKMSELWYRREIAAFIKETAKQICIVLCLTAVIIVGGFVIGLRLLELMYGVSLMQYRHIFLMLLGFGGFAAVAFYLNTMITVIRKQHFILVGYGSALLIHFIVTNRLVKGCGLFGAALSYGIIVSFLMLFYFAVIMIQCGIARKRQVR